MRLGKFGTTAAKEVGGIPTDPLRQKFEQYRDMFLRSGKGKTDAEDRAAYLACMNRVERRRWLRERGPKRGLPRTMAVPKGKR